MAPVWCSLLLSLAPAVEYDVQMTFYHGDPLGSVKAGTVKILSKPSMMQAEGQQGYFEVGNAESPTLVLKVTPTQGPGNTIRFSGDIVYKFDDGIDQVNFASVVTPGEPFRIRIGRQSVEVQTWAEFTVRKATPPSPFQFQALRLPIEAEHPFRNVSPIPMPIEQGQP